MTSKYEKYTNEQLEELFSNFQLDSWSYSKVTSFARNEKAFEMQYVYREESRRSASSVAGNAYHKALEEYFYSIKEKKAKLDIVNLIKIAMDYILDIPANIWKIQKTTPSVEKCIETANKSTVVLIQNFFKELSVYLDDLEEILAVELYCDEWLTINGVDIPIPCHAVPDLVIKTKDGKVVVIDHKSVRSFTDDEEVALTFGKQGITYAKVIEKKLNIAVDEVWFIQNKSSKNKNGDPQLKVHKIILDKDTTKLLEAMLYEPLKRMIEAISDPDYVYMINDSDNFVSKAELYEFWTKTMIAEIETFNIPDNKVELIQKRINKIRNASLGQISPKVISTFQKKAASFITYNLNNKNMTKQQKIEFILGSFSIPVEVAHSINGFSSDTFLLNVASGVKIASLNRHKLDIANALDVSNVRTSENLLVYKDKSYVPIEINKMREKDLLWDKSYSNGMKIPMGVNNFGETIYWDLDNHSTPHAIIGGATGSGKSEMLYSTISYASEAGIDDIVVFDTKSVFSMYDIPGMRVVDEFDELAYELGCLVAEMEERKKTKVRTKKLIVFDEFADAKMSKDGKEVEELVQRLAQKGRAFGFRIILATQRPSVKVINGDIKVNFDVQICLKVKKEVDSVVILDEVGGNTLMGQGDALLKSSGYLNTERIQGFFKKD